MRRRDTTPSTSAPLLDTHATPEIFGVLRVMPPTPPMPTPRGASPPAPTGLLTGQVYPVSGDAVTLGRDLHNNAVLLDPAVSRFQALMERGPAGWSIANLSAQQPIGIDALSLAPGQAAALLPGATLLLGATRLEWLIPCQPSRTEDTPAAGTPSRDARVPHMLAPGVTLQFAVRARGRRGLWWALALAGLALLIVGGILTLATVLLIGHQALGASGAGRVAAAIALPLVPALSIALLVTLIDRYEREPFSLLVLAFLWGALIGIPIALFAERAVEAALSAPGAGAVLAQALSAGLLEEGVKGAGSILLLLALRDQFDNVTDGIVYGLAIGAGFALIENYTYLALSPASAFPGLILDRILLSWLGHSTFSALFGASLGHWREAHVRRGFWRAALIGFAAAAALHVCFDAIVLAGGAAAATTTPASFAVLLIVLGAYLPLFAAQALLFRLLLAALAREAEILRSFLAGEVLAGVVTPEEYVRVQNATIRLAVERHLLFTAGLRDYRLGYALHQAIIGLAMRKWHVAAGDPLKAGARQPEDAYRERIAALRRALTLQARLSPEPK